MKTQKQLLVVCGVLVNNKNILLQQRIDQKQKDAHLKWEFPGGKIEFGETPDQAIRREFLEETGRKVSLQSLLPIVVTKVWEYPNELRQVFCLIYLCKLLKNGKPIKPDPTVGEVRWFSFDEVLQVEALPGVVEVIREVKKII